MLRGREDTYRIRVGNYRVIYLIEYANEVVLIDEILRRNERTSTAVAVNPAFVETVVETTDRT